MQAYVFIKRVKGRARALILLTLAGISLALALFASLGAASVSSTGQGAMPSLAGAVEWLNSPELSTESLRGKVVLVDFWTYDCGNCRRALPYVNAWAKKYAADGLVVIGVHTPEYAHEKISANVRQQVRQLGIEYPVAIDSQNRIWNAFHNQFWPAHYLIDARGQVRYSHFGEGSYAEQEQAIQSLLQEKEAR
jgi:thiol-disulfide isomerase/thioredoxin